MTTLYFDVGENKQTRTWTLRNGPLPTSPAVDLTTATGVVLICTTPFPTPSKACTFVADATGSVSVTMLAADLTLSGRFNVKTRVTFADGTIADFPKPGFDEIDVGTPS